MWTLCMLYLKKIWVKHHLQERVSRYGMGLVVRGWEKRVLPLTSSFVPGWLAKFSVLWLGTCQLRASILRGSQTSCVGISCSEAVEDGCIWGHRMNKKDSAPLQLHTAVQQERQREEQSSGGEHKRPLARASVSAAAGGWTAPGWLPFLGRISGAGRVLCPAGTDLGSPACY